MPYIVLDPSTAEPAPTVDFGAPEVAADHPMGKSLLSLRTRLKLELGKRDDIPDSVWNEWINDGLFDVWTGLKLSDESNSFPLTLVVDQPLYALPPTVLSIRSIGAADPVHGEQGTALTEIDVQTYRKLPVRSGTPEVWFPEKRMIVFWPTPDKAYELAVDFKGRPQPLTADTDYPPLDDKWHEIVFTAAKYRAWTGVQNDTKSALVETQMTRLVQRKNSEDAENEETKYPTMRPIRSRIDLMNLRRGR